MPVPGDGRSGLLSATVTQYGGYNRGATPPTPVSVGTSRLARSAAAGGGDAPGLLFEENFEGGTDGATITTGNTLFSAVDTGWTFSAASPAPAQGSLCAVASVAPSATATATATFTAQSQVYRRAYLRVVSAYPAAVSGIIFARASAAVVATIRLTATGTLQVRDGATTAYTTTTAVPLDAWVRVEWRIDGGNAQQQLRLFTGANLHGTTADEDSGSVAFSGAAPDDLRIGISNGSASASAVLAYDAVADDGAWVGPYVATPADATITGIDAQAGGWADPGAATIGQTVAGADAWARAWTDAGSTSTSGAVPDTPTLLARPNQTAPTGVVTTQYADNAPLADETYDLRNHEAQGFFFADAIFGYASYDNGAGGTNATAHELNLNPYEFGKTTAGTRTAVIGGKSIGDQTRSLSWEDMKHGSPVEDAIDGGMDPATAYATYIPGNNNMDGDALRIHVAAGSWAVIDGFRADNTMDGVGLYSTNDALTDTGDVYVRNCWFNFGHDDTIENDRAYLTLHVDDCLFERVHCAFSYRANVTTGSPDQSKVITVRDSVIWQYPKPGPSQQPRSVLASGNFYKSQANSPPLVMVNVVWAVEKLAASGQADLPTGTGCSYTNVTIVWLGAGAYPGNVPTGCTVTTDATVLTDAVALWKARHGVSNFNTVDMARMIAPLAGTVGVGSDAQAGGAAPAGAPALTTTGADAWARGWTDGGTVTVTSTVTGADAEATGNAPAGVAQAGSTVTGTDTAATGWTDAGTLSAGASVAGLDAQAAGFTPIGAVITGTIVTGVDAWTAADSPAGSFTATAQVAGDTAAGAGWADAGQALSGTVVTGADAWARAWAGAGTAQVDQTVGGADAWARGWTDGGTVSTAADATVQGTAAYGAAYAPAGSVTGTTGPVFGFPHGGPRITVRPRHPDVTDRPHTHLATTATGHAPRITTRPRSGA